MCLLCPYEINRAKYPHDANAINTSDQPDAQCCGARPKFKKNKNVSKLSTKNEENSRTLYNDRLL